MPGTADCIASYEEAFHSLDFSQVPLDANVTFSGPMATVSGKAEVVAFLAEASRQMSDFQVKQQVVEGDHACGLFQFTAAGNVIEGCDYFRVANGSIAEIRAFFDPRPITG